MSVIIVEEMLSNTGQVRQAGKPWRPAISQAKQLIKVVLNDFLIGTLAVLRSYGGADRYISRQFGFDTVFGVQEAVGNYGVTFLAFASVFGLLTYIGHTVNKRRHSLVLSLVDLAIERVPFLNTIYRVTKKIVDMFRSKPDEQKREVVYVEYPRKGMWLPAYVTNREGDRYVLYVPLHLAHQRVHGHRA